MNKVLILCTGLMLTLFSNAQDFKGSKWATSNKDSAFYKADAIKFLKLTDPVSGLSNNEYSEDLPDYYGGSNFIVMEFKKKHRLKFSTVLVNSWLVGTKKGKYQWFYNKGTGVIKLLYNSQVIGEFKIISQSKTKVKSKLSSRNEITTDEIVLVRI